MPGLDTTVSATVRDLPLDQITAGTQIIRTDPDDDSISELAYDLAVRGQLQPIGVTETGPDQYQLLYGHRRCLALRRLGHRTVRATIHDAARHDIKATALAENLHRRQLSLSEECEAVRVMHFDGQKSPDQIAAMLGKSRAWVMKRLAIPNYPPDISTALFHDHLTLGQAEALANVGDESARLYLTTQAQLHRIPPHQIKEMARAWEQPGGITDAVAAADEYRNNAPACARTLVRCLACDQTRDLAETVLIRVCAGGCGTGKQPNTDTDNAH
jgi:ParB/RepB/Spo0J family partition protein